MENVLTNWCKSGQKCNFGIIWADSGPTAGSPILQKKVFLAQNIKLRSIVKVCTVLRMF